MTTLAAIWTLYGAECSVPIPTLGGRQSADLALDILMISNNCLKQVFNVVILSPK